MSRLRYSIALIFCAGALSQAGAQGHIVGDNVITAGVDQFADGWTTPIGTVVITDDGVRPNELRRDGNAMLTIVDFLRARPPEHIKKDVADIEVLDAITGGSNREGVVNAFDGLMSTYWEPDSPSGAAQDIASEWWFTVDLGRLVIADRIVVRFAEDGDPFRLFDVLTSDGRKPASVPAGSSLDFTHVIQTLEPNSSQREFEVDLSNAGQEVREQAIRFIQVVVRASALGRGQEVADREAYDALDPSVQGLIEFTKLVGDGASEREFAVDEDVYNRIQDFRRGPIRYYRRELPRLAELEVWGGADEIVGGALLRGGSVETTQAINPDQLIDGNVESKISVKTHVVDVGGPLGTVLFDLGSSYWVNAQRMVSTFSGSDHTVSFPNYFLDFSDGAREPDGSLSWNRVVSVEQDEVGVRSLTGRFVSSLIHVDRVEFDLVKARFFKLEWIASNHLAGHQNFVNLAEMQLFGTGFQPEVWIESDPIRLPGSQNLTEIQWEADTPPGTRVVMQTKTGNVLLPDTLYYKDDGTLLGRGEEGSKKYYGRAFKNSQGDKVVIFEEGPEWSDLSELYEDASGTAITSPAPRSILKIRATLISDSPDVAATLKSIKLNFSDPVARRLVGEVTPTRVEVLGIEQSFSIFVGIDSLEQGFNELLLRAPSGMVIGEDETMSGKVKLFSGPASLDELSPSDGPVQVLGYGDSLHVSFSLLADDVEVVRLDFPATLYSAGGRLEVSLRNSNQEFWQRVDVGDALREVTSNALLVVAQPETKELIQGLSISPRVATPNDDGVNDELIAEFTVVLLGDNETVEMEIFDLSGHLVRQITQNRVVSAGRYRMAWDGMDDNNRLVPPGLYTVRLGVAADTDGAGLARSHLLQTVAVTY